MCEAYGPIVNATYCDLLGRHRHIKHSIYIIMNSADGPITPAIYVVTSKAHGMVKYITIVVTMEPQL